MKCHIISRKIYKQFVRDIIIRPGCGEKDEEEVIDHV